MPPSSVRASARQTAAQQTKTPSSIVSSSFSVPTPAVAANDNPRPKTRPGDENQILPNNAVPKGDSGSRGKIYGLSTYKTPEQVANDNAARQRSLVPDSPNYNPNPEAQKNLAQGQFEDLLDATKIRQTDSGDDQPTSAANDNPSTEQNTESQTSFDNPEEQYQLPLDIPDGDNTDKINKIRSELKKIGYDVKENEMPALLSCNFKVRLGLELHLWSAFRIIVEPVIGLTGSLLTTLALSPVGWAAAAAAWLFTSLKASDILAIGLGLFMAQFIASFIFSIIGSILKFRYTRNASDVIKSVDSIRKKIIETNRVRNISYGIAGAFPFGIGALITNIWNFRNLWGSPIRRSVHEIRDIVHKYK